VSKDATAARLVAALNEAALREAPGADLVSVELNFISAEAIARVEARTERRTRTLAFLVADAFDQAGARVASGSSVHKIA
jgi:hypothetical protein